MTTSEDVVRVTISPPGKPGDLDYIPTLSVNDEHFQLAFYEPFDLPARALPALMDSTFKPWIIVSSPDVDPVGDDDAAGGEPGGGAASGDTFDPETVIFGTVPEVAARLPGLTADQLDLVEAAENQRGQPRVGVINAIAAARAELSDT